MSSLEFADYDKQVAAFTMEEQPPQEKSLFKRAAKVFVTVTRKIAHMCKLGVHAGAKATLSVGLFPSTLTDKPDRQFHWDIILSERGERRGKMRGTRFRVKPHPTQGWVYEAIVTEDIRNIPDLLARIVIADVHSPHLAERIISSTPMLLENADWRCYDWVADALSKLASAGCVSLAKPSGAGGPLPVDKSLRIDARGQRIQVLDWPAIMQFSRHYVEGKIVAGRYTRYENLDAPRPTYNMLTETEIWV